MIDRRLPKCRELPRIFAIGIGVWLTNLLFIFGVKWVSDADAAEVGTLMQPCLPVVTTLLAILLRFERSSTYVPPTHPHPLYSRHATERRRGLVPGRS